MSDDLKSIKEIVLEPRSFGRVSFGAKATIKDKQDAGLFHVVIDKEPLGKFQRYGERQEIIDVPNKTVTIYTPVIDMDENDIRVKRKKEWKEERQERAENITVTHKGITYQCGLESQTRMANAVVALPDVVIDEDGTITRLSDGAVKKPDGTVVLEDGTEYLTDGTVKKAGNTFNTDGTIVLKNGTVFGLDGTATLKNGTIYRENGVIENSKGIITPDGRTTLYTDTVFEKDGTIILQDGTIIDPDGTATKDGQPVDSVKVPKNTMANVSLTAPVKPEQPVSMKAPEFIASLPWTALDNNDYELTKEDFKAILLDAMLQQSKFWNKNRP